MTNTISFPGLGGISFDVNRVAFKVFGNEIYWYALIILTGFLAGLAFVYGTCEKRNVKKDHVFDIAFWGLIIGLACARLYYVIFDPSTLDGNILNIFQVRNGGLAIYGGLIGAVATALVYCKKKKLDTLNVLDIFVPGLMIGQFIGRWGNFVNAEVFGTVTSLPWGMSINGSESVHPLFLYESLWNFVGFILVVLLRDKKKADGQVFFSYTLWYGFGRFFLEGMRQPQYILWLIPNKLGISQLVAILAVVISAGVLIYLSKRRKEQ